MYEITAVMLTFISKRFTFIYAGSLLGRISVSTNLCTYKTVVSPVLGLMMTPLSLSLPVAVSQIITTADDPCVRSVIIEALPATHFK